MKKIGFIDYFLSEWHANKYPEWIKTAGGDDFCVAYAWAELDASPYDQVTTGEWCAKFGVQPCASIEEVCEKSDCLIVLSPDNPEKHLSYAQKVLPYQKPVYIDKTFATSLREAEEIFELAERCRTPMFSSSALRYSTELEGHGGVARMLTTGGGASLDRYAVHQLEMIVSVMGTGIERIMCVMAGKINQILLEYADGRTAGMSQTPNYPFSATIESAEDDAAPVFVQIASDFFMGLTRSTLAFFTDGVPPLDKTQTLQIMSVIESIPLALSKPFEWIQLNKYKG